jgi:hypothetical protein
METKLVSQLFDSLDIEPSQIFWELSVSHPLLNIMPPKLHVQSPVRKKLKSSVSVTSEPRFMIIIVIFELLVFLLSRRVQELRCYHVITHNSVSVHKVPVQNKTIMPVELRQY